MLEMEIAKESTIISKDCPLNCSMKEVITECRDCARYEAYYQGWYDRAKNLAPLIREIHDKVYEAGMVRGKIDAMRDVGR